MKGGIAMRQAKFTKTLSMAVQPELYRKIKNITDEERISIAEWFRRIAEKALSNSVKEGKSNHDWQSVNK